MHEDTCPCLQPNRCCPGIERTWSGRGHDVPLGEGYRVSSTTAARPLISDLDTLQLDQVHEPLRPNCCALSTPTVAQWQQPPPLPQQHHRHYQRLRQIPTSPMSTQTSTQTAAGPDPVLSDPTVRLINFNDSYTTPAMNRNLGQSVPWGTPSYRQVTGLRVDGARITVV